jgi:hypothetical protein
LTVATLAGVVSGAIAGTPASLPTNWELFDQYLLGPGTDLDSDTFPSGTNFPAGTDLEGANLAYSTITNATFPSGINFQGGDLTYGDFAGTTYPTGTNFEVADGSDGGNTLDCANFTKRHNGRSSTAGCQLQRHVHRNWSLHCGKRHELYERQPDERHLRGCHGGLIRHHLVEYNMP